MIHLCSQLVHCPQADKGTVIVGLRKLWRSWKFDHFSYYVMVRFLLPALKQSVPVLCVHVCIFSWHNWAIRVTLMHHIYLLFITGRICTDWLRIFLWQLFSQPLFKSILEFHVFCLSLFHLNKDKEGGDVHSVIFKHSSLLAVFLWAVCSLIRGENGCKIAG